MGGDGVSDVSAGAGEEVGGMVNGAGLISGSIARSGACGSGSSVEAETHVDRSLSKNAGLSVSYTNYHAPPQTTSTTNLKLYTNLSSNLTHTQSHMLTPQIPPSTQQH